jgi:predicted GNAT superfamily acetyltransferase
MIHAVNESHVSAAREESLSASARAGVVIDNLNGTDVREIEMLIDQVWGPDQVSPSNLLRGIAHAGNSLLLARKSGVAVGFAFGYMGWAGSLHLHSHMTAVSPGVASSGVGYALKLAQRALCLEHGVTEIRWTYDPLVARNAYFNLIKLGARVVAFHPDFYLGMDDKINAGDRTDRFEVSWQLNGEVGIDHDLDGQKDRRNTRIEIPPDIEGLRASNMAEALELRIRIRDVFAVEFAKGHRPLWDEGVYVFTNHGDLGS